MRLRYGALRQILVTAALFIIQSAIALSIVVLVAGSMFRDHPWSAIGWLTLGLTVAWILTVLPTQLTALFWNDGLFGRAIYMYRHSDPVGDVYEINYERARALRIEIYLLGCLISLAGAAFLVTYLSSRITFTAVAQQQFGPSETAQVITAVGGLGLAIGTSIAAIIKAYALLLRARADILRARRELTLGRQLPRDTDPD